MQQQNTARELIETLFDISQTAGWSAMPSATPDEMRDALQAIARTARDAIAKAGPR